MPSGEAQIFLQFARLETAFGTLRLNGRRAHYKVEKALQPLPLGLLRRKALRAWRDRAATLKKSKVQVSRYPVMEAQAKKWHFKHRAGHGLRMW